MAHRVERRPSETMDMEYVYMDLDCLDEQDTMLTSRRNYYEHEYSSHLAPAEPCANVSNTLHTQQQPQHQFGCTSYNNTPRSRSPRSKTPPPRTDSGESHRSLTRRGAAGHAEMQRSAFLSSPNHVQQGRMKIKAELGSSQDTDDQPHHKRPRRFTKDPKDEERA